MCITPLTLKRNRDEWQTDKTTHSTVTRIVPCGKCFQCLARRRNGWSFRLWHQLNVAESACFMTLTYGDSETGGEDPPLSKNGLPQLNRKHLQDFLKRLRKYEKTKLKNDTTIKYYAVGEYGTNNHRPHYHLIIFNLSSATIARSNMVAEKIWKKGFVDIAVCNIKSINYVVGYINQGAWVAKHELDDRTPHFSVMSKGLGSSYLTDRIAEMHLNRMDGSVMHPSGFRIPMPRYYKDQIFTVEEKADLYEIAQAWREMDWEEFANYDYSREVMIIKHKIQQNEKKRKTERQFI
jgi:hypothetical protein